MGSIIQFVDTKTPSPPLLPILRSRQQADLLTYLLSDPDVEHSLSDLAKALDIPFSTVHREVGRAERAGIVESRKLGNIRLVRANAASPYFDGLADVLMRAFGPPQVVAEALAGVPGVDEVYLFGSWALGAAGIASPRPIGDVDVLVLGEPHRNVLYEAAATASTRLGRHVEVTVRKRGWLAHGEGSFHDTVSSRPLVQVLPKREIVKLRTDPADPS